MSDPGIVLGDLRDEGDELDGLVAGLAAQEWATLTPAPGWTVAHQIAHLAWTDARALQSAVDPDGFAREVEKAMASPETFVDEGAERGALEPPAELLERWRQGRASLHQTLAAQPPGTRLPWYGPPMSIPSVATGRLMETWAHGQDIADALGVRRAPTERLWHVARIGVRARDYAYAVRGLAAPGEEFRVELTSPAGHVWAYGPEDAAQRVAGPALDFCLLVTQRAHRADLAVRAEGADADGWLDIAQAFAGPPGPGRAQGAADTAAHTAADTAAHTKSTEADGGKPGSTGQPGDGGRPGDTGRSANPAKPGRSGNPGNPATPGTPA
ncbi:TIGR03084 family metal-binding protein [Streptomyces sp. H27-D2]|uniref:TIGR03084 family metal-binding protein n=1 Tax=Streptomyces sp. H27-D2 TaxID=3046304 RepID=UPI002DBB5E68|nr:TIGR03084 family metal-binding protein [Streptomyces sp. H27-D2]MEC4016830.1 TIGR03084 family metal-binding protein [Streptomyces sp. H27-D2]